MKCVLIAQKCLGTPYLNVHMNTGQFTHFAGLAQGRDT